MRNAFVALVLVVFPNSGELIAQVGSRRQPIPIEVVTSYRELLDRVPLDVTSDGEWLSYSVNNPKLHVQGQSYYYSASGVPVGNGREVWLTNTRTGETVTLSRPGRSSWSGSWSPDGSKLAFYADWSGTAAIWIWDRATRTTSQLSNLIARPLFHFEGIRWDAGSKRVLTKVLPEGMTIGEVNNMTPKLETSRFPADRNAPSVFVLKHDPFTEKNQQASQKMSEIHKSDWTNSLFSDLAIINVQNGSVKRIAKRSRLKFYSFSPDNKYVLYTTWEGAERNSQQNIFDLFIYDLEKGSSLKIAGIRMAEGMGVSWSPDSKSIGFVTSSHGVGGPTRARGEVYVVNVSNAESRKVGGNTHPNFQSSYRPPFWDGNGKNLYLIGSGGLWKIDLQSDKAIELGNIPEKSITQIATPFQNGTLWMPDTERSIVVNTLDRRTKATAFYKISLDTGQTTKLMENDWIYKTGFCFDASSNGRLFFSAQNSQNSEEIWSSDSQLQDFKRVTNINPEFNTYEMGRARLIDWTIQNGQKLQGSLLLPSGYQKGVRYPLIVWTYGGGTGSDAVNTFGFSDIPILNMQVLASRGYAVLYPDSPLRVGTPMKDIHDTVMAGVEKTVELGIADPERLGVMGQSYGSYSTLALITQTERFKAASVTAIAPTDLVSGYLFMTRDGTTASLGYYEEGQGRMGGTLWEFPERYVENSPIFKFDKIVTPLLIGHGTDDGLPLTNADTIFAALRRLNKTVEYRQYENEGHVILKDVNVIDFWNRRLEWFEKYLKAPETQSKTVESRNKQSRMAASNPPMASSCLPETDYRLLTCGSSPLFVASNSPFAISSLLFGRK